MKRYLKQNRHELSDWEKENVWLSIEKSGRPFAGRNGRRSFRPALAFTAAAALAIVVFAGWFGISGSPESIVGRDGGVVVLPPERRADSMDVRDPAQDARATLQREDAMRRTARAATPKSAPAPVTEGVEVAGAPAAGQGNAEVEFRQPQASPPVVNRSLPDAADRGRSEGVLRGVVRNAATGAGLDGATVRLRGTRHLAITHDGGRFEFSGLEAGQSCELQVQHPGYEELRRVAVAQEGEPGLLRCELVARSVERSDAADDEGGRSTDEAASAVTEPAQTRAEARALEQVRRALDRMAERPRKNGEVHVRGGRSGLVAPDEVMVVAAPRGSVTGGTAPPNGERYELMYFEHAGVNPFLDTRDDSLSTFALDVDNASWTMARNYLRRGALPPQDAIRVEEFVNAFDAGWPRHTDDAFRIRCDGAPSRFGDKLQLLRIGIVGRTVDDSRRKPANLVFVVDISGSMNRENRLGLVQRALHVLLDELREGDRVGIVVYGSRGRVLLEPTDIARRKTIESAIDALGPGGSTNAFEGLELAYDMARRTCEAGKLNRLILCSDGVANTGASTAAEQMLKRIRRSSDEGITLSTIGFGMGNYNDVLMEKLADQGDGNYYYVDEFEEAERVLRENLTGLLQTVARETKVQVAFDPERVERWRLLGYENRDVADRDFRNDAVDAGEVGAGHQVTALYELKLVPGEQDAAPGGFEVDDVPIRRDQGARLGEVRLRWEAPAHDTAHAGEVTEIARPIRRGDLADGFSDGSIWLRTQAVVAEFAEILRGSYWARESRLADLIPVADALSAEAPGDEKLRELADLVRIAARLESDAAGGTGPDVGEVPPETD